MFILPNMGSSKVLTHPQCGSTQKVMSKCGVYQPSRGGQSTNNMIYDITKKGSVIIENGTSVKKNTPNRTSD
jgi:hypothetical protein